MRARVRLSRRGCSVATKIPSVPALSSYTPAPCISSSHSPHKNIQLYIYMGAYAHIDKKNTARIQTETYTRMLTRLYDVVQRVSIKIFVIFFKCIFFGRRCHGYWSEGAESADFDKIGSAFAEFVTFRCGNFRSGLCMAVGTCADIQTRSFASKAN